MGASNPVDWPLITIPADGRGANGVTIPVKQIALVGETPDGEGCRISIVGGHTVTLWNVNREEFTKGMEDAIAGRPVNITATGSATTAGSGS